MGFEQYTDGSFEAGEPTMTPTTLTVLGATGSVGQNTLDLVGRHPGAFEIVALTARTNVQQLAELARRHGAKLAVIENQAHFQTLKSLLSDTEIEVAAGEDALIEAAQRPVDCVMAAIVGAAGLRATFAAAGHAKRIALANKECLVCAGDIFMREIASRDCELLPVDSEHSGVFQALASASQVDIEKITLTASGGPFRTWSCEQMARATVEQALNHPNWSMGDKITIDSATMMNKGLELIEAFHLFPVSEQQLDCVIHPQSVVHCLVSFKDGATLAHLSAPDMRTPIAYALGWPKRLEAPTKRLDLEELSNLTFNAADDSQFPALKLARDAMRKGGTAPAVLNAANEIAVAGFLNGKIEFGEITTIVAWALEQADRAGLLGQANSVQDVLDVDVDVRKRTQSRFK